MGYPTILPGHMVIPIVKEFRFFLTGDFLIKKPKLIFGQLFLLREKKYDLWRAALIDFCLKDTAFGHAENFRIIQIYLRSNTDPMMLSELLNQITAVNYFRVRELLSQHENLHWVITAKDLMFRLQPRLGCFQ
jgi:hypothetical protein